MAERPYGLETAMKTERNEDNIFGSRVLEREIGPNIRENGQR